MITVLYSAAHWFSALQQLAGFCTLLIGVTCYRRWLSELLGRIVHHLLPFETVRLHFQSVYHCALGAMDKIQ